MINKYDWRPEQASKSLQRILPGVEKAFAKELQQRPKAWHKFLNRLDREWPRLFTYLHQLYGWQYDFFYTLERILYSLVQFWLERPEELKSFDDLREADPSWFESEKMAGGVLYVDLFSDNLAKLGDHIPYFKKLGLTYLHLMPLFVVPREDNDGGYAVATTGLSIRTSVQ